MANYITKKTRASTVRPFIYEKHYISSYESTNQRQDETFAEIENLDKSEQTQKYLAELRENDKKYDEGCQQIAAAVKAGDMPKAMQIAAAVKEFADTLQTISDEWDAAVAKTTDEAIARTESDAESRDIITYTVAAVAIIASILLGLLLSRSISKPVNALSQAADELSKGNLTVAVPEVKTKDEIEGLAKAFGVMVQNLRELIRSINETAESVANIQKLTDSAVKAMDEGTGQVEQGSGLAIDAGNALKEILATVEETYNQVQNISAAAEQISASSQEVVKAIDNVTASVEAISVATAHLSEMAADLRKQVARFTV